MSELRKLALIDDYGLDLESGSRSRWFMMSDSAQWGGVYFTGYINWTSIVSVLVDVLCQLLPGH